MSQTKCIYKSIINTHRYIHVPKDAASSWVFWQRAKEALDVLSPSTNLTFSERSYLGALKKAIEIAFEKGVVPERVKWVMTGVPRSPQSPGTAEIVGLRTAPPTPLRNKYTQLLQRIEPLLSLPEYAIPSALQPDEYEEEMPFRPRIGLPEALRIVRMLNNGLTTLFKNGTPPSVSRKHAINKRIEEIHDFDVKFNVRRWSEMEDAIERYNLLIYLQKICFDMTDPVSLNDFASLSAQQLKRVIALLENPPPDLPLVPFDVRTKVIQAALTNIKGHCFQQQSLKAIPAPRKHPLTRRLLNSLENVYINRDST